MPSAQRQSLQMAQERSALSRTHSCSFYCRQRYVSLLERIPEQMKTLYKKMMSQRLVNRRFSEELLLFKESVEQLARSESCPIRRGYLCALSATH